METGSPGKRPVLPKRARLLVTAGMGMLALLLFGPRLVDIYVDWLWFGEVGFRSVWITVLLTRLAIVAAVALVVAGIVLAALLLAYRSRPFFVPDEPQRDRGRAAADDHHPQLMVTCSPVSKRSISTSQRASSVDHDGVRAGGRLLVLPRLELIAERVQVGVGSNCWIPGFNDRECLGRLHCL